MHLLKLVFSVSTAFIPNNSEIYGLSVASDQVELNADKPMVVTVEIPRRTTIGTRKAGLVCLPDGRFKIEEFVSSNAHLRAVMDEAFIARGLEQTQNQLESVVLKGLNVSLCARDYLFDKNTFSGKASFTFLFRFRNGDEFTETANLKIEKQQAQSESDILQSAVIDIVEIMASKAH